MTAGSSGPAGKYGVGLPDRVSGGRRLDWELSGYGAAGSDCAQRKEEETLRSNWRQV